MKKWILAVLMIFTIMMSVGCQSQPDQSTIRAHGDSKYQDTFKELGIGKLFDFSYQLPEANNRWVNVWVDRYRDGKKDENPLIELSYGNNPENYEEGSLGLGILRTNSDDASMFLYAEDMKLEPVSVGRLFEEGYPTSYGFTIEEDEDVTLQLGETKALAVYFQAPQKDVVKIRDSRDEEELLEIIEESAVVLVLHMKIEERMEP